MRIFLPGLSEPGVHSQTPFSPQYARLRRIKEALQRGKWMKQAEALRVPAGITSIASDPLAAPGIAQART
jgi:hypothetical protein